MASELSEEMKSVLDQFRFIDKNEPKKRQRKQSSSDDEFSPLNENLKRVKSFETNQPIVTSVKIPKPKKAVVKISESESISEEEIEDETEDETEDSDFANSDYELEQAQNETYQFFNSATAQQLQDATGCSSEQADIVVEKRPFTSYRQLEKALTETRGVSARLLQSYSEIMLGYKTIDGIIMECDQVGTSIVKVLNKWQDSLSSGAVHFNHLNELEESNEPIVLLESEDLPEKKHETITVHLSETEEDDDDDDYKEEDLRSTSSADNDFSVARHAEQIKPSDFENEDGLLLKQPSCVAPGLHLKDYQLIGVSWLNLLWRHNISGILADDMGLGKTAQVICFLGYLQQRGYNGPHLIIVPSSTIDNWLREFQRFCPQLIVKAYRGGQNERADLRYEYAYSKVKPNAIVTTYNMATSAKDDRSFFRKLKASSLILDEGHLVKNAMTSRHKNLVSIPADFRLLLTGTPLQNNLKELMALLAFILPKVFGAALEEGAIQTIFSGKVASRQDSSNFLCQNRIQRAKKMMAPFVMRRKKSDVLTELPPKTESITFCEMTSRQRASYERLVRGAVSSRDSDGSNQKQLSNMLVHFRKMADHPLLFRELYSEEKVGKMARSCLRELDFADMSLVEAKNEFLLRSDYELHQLCLFYKSLYEYRLQKDEWLESGKVKELQKALEKHHANGDRVLVFSQFTKMLDILEAVMRTLNYKFLRLDGSTPVSDRQALIDDFNNDDQYLVFLLSTKAAGTGINLASANAVILYDLDFNPHNDAQAENRAHRVGQTKPVTVTKLICKGTIDEWILDMGQIKRKLEQSLTRGQSGLFGLMYSDPSNADISDVGEQDQDDSLIQETACNQLLSKLNLLK